MEMINSYIHYILYPIIPIFYIISCLNLGLFLFHIFGRYDFLNKNSPLIVLSSAFIMGSGVISSIWLILATFGWFRLAVVLLILITSFISGSFFLKQWIIKSLLQIKNIINQTRSDSWGWQGLAILCIIFTLAGITTIISPWAGDAIAFYLAVPKLVASSNQLMLLPTYESFMSVGLMGEMHIAAFMKLLSGGDPYPFKIFSWFNFIITPLILLGICAQVGIKCRGQWLALAAYLSSTAVLYMVGWGKTDILSVATGIAAYYFALVSGPLWIIGLLLGFAGVMKLSYLVTLFPGVAILLIWNWTKDLPLREYIRSRDFHFVKNIAIKGGQVLGWSLLAFLPHFIKNGVLLGAPFAPIGLSGIGWMEQIFYTNQTTLKIVLTYPLALSFGNYYAQVGNISPILLAFLPFVFMLPRSPKWLKSPLVAISSAGTVGMILWLIRFPSVLSPRYYLPTLLIFVPLLITGAENITYIEKNPRILSFLILVCTYVILISVNANQIFPYDLLETLKYILGKTPECENQYMLKGLCQVEEIVNQNAKLGDRVYLASSYRYWLRPDLLQCTNGSEDRPVVQANNNVDWVELYKRGFKFVVVDGSRPAFDSSISDPPSWVKVIPLKQIEQVHSYLLEYIYPPDKVNIACKSTDQKVWKLVSP